MSVGILLITHRPLGADLLRVTTGIFGTCPARAEFLEVENDAPCDQMLAQAELLAGQINAGDGVLVLTDLYGATPANIAFALRDRHRDVRVVAGVNLPMLLRALNYAGLDLDTVTEKAVAGGRDGIRRCPGPAQEGTTDGT